MVKITLDNDIESWYINEIIGFFKRSRKLKYKVFAKIIKRELDISLKKLLTKSPDELEKLARRFLLSYPIDYIEHKELFEDMYGKFRDSISGSAFIEKINLKVCPYCNRNYIFNFKKKTSVEATAQLDHFYDKSKYAYFGLCLYNLVPSCSTCNQRKSAADAVKNPIFNPYADNIHNHINFSALKIENRDELLQKDSDFFSEERMTLSIEKDNSDRQVEEHLKVFNIEELYIHHKDIVSDLYKKRRVYSDKYINELLDQNREIFKDRDELLQLVVCTYIKDDEMNKRPMSKLTKDIAIEVGFIKE